MQSFEVSRAGGFLASLLLATPAIVCAQAAQPNVLGSGGNADGYDMAPETRAEVVAAAAAAIPDKIPAGPYSPEWDSLKAHYKVPTWFNDAKFGLFMHWGLYSVPAHHKRVVQAIHVRRGIAVAHRELRSAGCFWIQGFHSEVHAGKI